MYPSMYPTTVQLARIRWCQRNGHEWPPLREARPGDEHWCDYCGTLRVIRRDDGQPFYRREWE